MFPAAVNDPVFNLHHCNVDRVLESWMQRFSNGSNSPTLLPAYVPVCGGHPGHNRDDYMVPFFPLITAGEQYRVAEDWGYVYDKLIQPEIPDSMIPNCFDVLEKGTCPTCNANGICINCTDQTPTCPAPNAQVQVESVSPATDDLDITVVGLGLGLGIPLLIAILIIILMASKKKSKSEGHGKEYEMKTKT